MTNYLKKVFYILPRKVRFLIVKIIESIKRIQCSDSKKIIVTKKDFSPKKNILIYHINGLSFGGTEKNLQMIAKHLNKTKYNVFYLYSGEKTNSRMEYLGPNVKTIFFEHGNVHAKWPYFFANMTPHIIDVINENNIHLIVSASPGQTIYPLINIKEIPIILINIFGSFNTQPNIVKNLCVSNEVKRLANRVIDEQLLCTQYNPSERPMEATSQAKKIRERFNIEAGELVFGRIGRSDNTIFDPIGLLAFEIAQKKYPNIHYIIMSPAEAAISLVKERNIQNVHFLEASHSEIDVWAFHSAIDVLAHYRRDGESCGLNIIESMLVGNPILTHKSYIWNAHLEYLDISFSLIADIDNHNQYAENMCKFVEYHQSGTLRSMGQKAKEKAEKLFLIENIITRYETWFDEAMNQKLK